MVKDCIHDQYSVTMIFNLMIFLKYINDLDVTIQDVMTKYADGMKIGDVVNSEDGCCMGWS